MAKARKKQAVVEEVIVNSEISLLDPVEEEVVEEVIVNSEISLLDPVEEEVVEEVVEEVQEAAPEVGDDVVIEAQEEAIVLDGAGKVFRVYSKELHGENYQQLAEGFAKKKFLTVQ